MLIVAPDPELALHMALAMRRYAERLSVDRTALPKGWGELHDGFLAAARSPGVAPSGPEWSLLDSAEDRVESPLVEVEAAAQLLGVSGTTVRRLIKSGRLTTVRLGRRVLIHRTALERLTQEP